jgi:hypothetical protein
MKKRVDIEKWMCRGDFLDACAKAYEHAQEEIGHRVTAELAQYLAEAKLGGELDPPPYFSRESVAGEVIAKLVVDLCERARRDGLEVSGRVECGGGVYVSH